MKKSLAVACAAALISFGAQAQQFGTVVVAPYATLFGQLSSEIKAVTNATQAKALEARLQAALPVLAAANAQVGLGAAAYADRLTRNALTADDIAAQSMLQAVDALVPEQEAQMARVLLLNTSLGPLFVQLRAQQ